MVHSSWRRGGSLWEEQANVDEVGEIDVGKLVEEEAVSVEAVMMIAVAVD